MTLQGHYIATFGLGAALIFASAAWAQSDHQIRPSLGENGDIPAWLVAGPFELGIEGFGQVRDDDPIGEAEAAPVEGQIEKTDVVLGGQVSWQPFSVANSGYLDLMEAVGWSLPSDEPEKIWWAKAAYAYTTIESNRDRQTTLLTGSNSALKVVVNGEVVYKHDGERAAVANSDSISVRLKEGSNRLLIRVGQTHRNEGPSFFGGLPWQWGFFARFVDTDGIEASIHVDGQPAAPLITSTFFYRESGGELLQRFDLEIENTSAASRPARVLIETDAASLEEDLGLAPFGVSRHELWIPAVDSVVQGALIVQIGDASSVSGIRLEPMPRYKIHVAQMSHTDIGYTNIQPVVKERFLRWTDDVVKRCDEDPSFNWTIETVWQLEQYRLGRPESDFKKLIDYIKSGRIAVSPIYTNPFTGWISNEEMVRSFDLANWYAEEYGLEFSAAVYNDVPGLSWVVPQILNDNGIGFLATGINEVYGGYPLQRNLPKAWIWEGPGGGRVVTYRNEAYNEAQPFGLEKDTTAAKFKIWERLNRLKAQGHDHDLVLAIHTFGDNGPIPLSAGRVAKEWNEAYAWPRFEISTINDFADKFVEAYGDSLPTLRGDWTSTWDVQYQGEPERMIRQRWAQNNLPTAEKLATIAWLKDESQEPLIAITKSAYDNLLHFSGHGSGLEFGYGSPHDNLVAMAYREQYVDGAVLETTEVLERALFKLSFPEETFEGEALYLFNPLNWARDSPIEFEFPRENQHAYRPVDIETGVEIPYDFTGYTLQFVARDVPPLGFKKIRLQRIESGTRSTLETDLSTDGCTIENAFYRIVADCGAGVQSVIDKRNGRQLAGPYFGDPVQADSLMSLHFKDLGGVSKITVVDHRPARLVLKVERDDHLFTETSYELWQKYEQIVVNQTLDLRKLEETNQIQEFSARFEFELDDPEILIDLAGGLLDPETDRLPGVDHDLFAPRRGLTMSDGDYAVDWVGINNRVIRLRETEEARPVILANLVNNFPEAWNRWEPNAATLEYRFAIRGRTIDTTGTWGYVRFAWEAATPTVARYTWLRSTPASGSYLSIDGSVVVSSIRRNGSDVEIRLINPDTRHPVQAVIHTDLIGKESAGGMTDGNQDQPLRVDLQPGEISIVRMEARSQR